VTGQKGSKQHPYGVSVRSSALIESLARADLVRFVRLIRTYLHRPIPHFGLARQPARAFRSFSTPFTSLPGHAEAAYLAYRAYLATFLYFFCNVRPTHGGANLRRAPTRAKYFEFSRLRENYFASETTSQVAEMLCFDQGTTSRAGNAAERKWATSP
jgi:hypothetical protein